MPRQLSPQQQFGHLWLAEVARFEHNYDEDWEVALCADLADELWFHTVAAEEDPQFGDELYEWDCYILENELRLPLEQSCHSGILLPTGQRAVRLRSCPESLLRPLRWMFEECPRHVKAYLALYNYVLVRLDRARRTGNPAWRPETALPAPEERAFFRPPVLTFRNYAR
ncbi:MAG: hypothetical protein ACKVOO_08210 [Burkholderiaceae bacterium]